MTNAGTPSSIATREPTATFYYSRPHDRRVLPAVVRGAARAPRQRAISFDVFGRRTRRFPSVQTLPAERSPARGASGRGGRTRLPTDRRGVVATRARRTRKRGRHEPVPFSSRVQGADRCHAEGVRRCASRGIACAQELPRRAHRHRRDLRGRLQRQRTVLRRGGENARHEAARLSGRRRGHDDPLRGRRMFARFDPGCGDRARRMRDPAGRRSGRTRARSAGPLRERAR